MFGQHGGNKKSEQRKAANAAKGAGVAVVKDLYSKMYFAINSKIGQDILRSTAGGEVVVDGVRYVFAVPDASRLGTPEKDTKEYARFLFGDDQKNLQLTKGFVGHLLHAPWLPEPYTTPYFDSIKRRVLAHQGIAKPNDDTVAFMALFNKVDVTVNEFTNDKNVKVRSVLNASEMPTILKQLFTNAKIAGAMNIVLQGAGVDIEGAMNTLKGAGLIDFDRNRQSYLAELYRMFSSDKELKKYKPFVVIFNWSQGKSVDSMELLKALRKARKISKKSPSLYGRTGAELEAALAAPTVIDIMNKVRPQQRRKPRKDAKGEVEEKKEKFEPAKDAPIGEAFVQAAASSSAGKTTNFAMKADSDSEAGENDEEAEELENLKIQKAALEANMQNMMAEMERMKKELAKVTGKAEDEKGPAVADVGARDINWATDNARFAKNWDEKGKLALTEFLKALDKNKLDGLVKQPAGDKVMVTVPGGRVGTGVLRESLMKNGDSMMLSLTSAGIWQIKK